MVLVAERFFMLPQLELPLPKNVLVLRAQELLEAVGHDAPVVDQTAHFYFDGAYPGTDSGLEDPWSKVGSISPTLIRLLYRQSPVPLVPNSQTGRVTTFDPPNLTAGMARVSVDSRGRLVDLFIAPPQRDTTPPTAEAPPWAPLFTAAGLIEADLVSSVPSWNPAIDCDVRVAWEGHYPEQEQVPIRIEAGGYRGQAVYFRIITPWTTAEREAASGSDRLQAAALVFLNTLFLIGAALLARWNWRRGRGDSKGGFRFGLFFTVLATLVSLLLMHHVASAAEYTMIIENLSGAITGGVIMWLAYLALEPYARRLWPESLITWSRVLAGRFRDPRVARDLLIGGAAGVSLTGVELLFRLLRTFSNGETSRPIGIRTSILDGFSGALSTVPATLAQQVQIPFILLLLLLLFRIVSRRPWLAWVSVIVFLTLVGAATGDLLTALENGFFVSVLLVMTVRLGVFAAMTCLWFNNFPQAVPLSTDFSAWYTGQCVVLWLLPVALAVHAFVTTTRGKTFFEGSLLEV